jgi:caffeoyl-CoA O-methyltransferase
MPRFVVTIVVSLFCSLLTGTAVFPADADRSMSDRDARVSQFLSKARRSWSDMNVPYEDGKLLYNSVVTHGYRRILEIGTSTGHSTIWLAWAASKTGGRVITIEIDKGRHEIALKNLKTVGLDRFVDARLADAHELVPLLEGPFDFVFCDADKEWYLQYFKDLQGKISPWGCFAAHNVLWKGDKGIDEFLTYVEKAPGFSTIIERGSGEGISVSCRAAP